MEAARRANVLFVDDEPRVLSSMRALFRRDYNVHLANSGNEALALLDREDMDVIVSDQRMPGMTGIEVLKACKDRAPRAMRILLTGYADKQAIADSINEGEVFRYLTKPCARDTLRETLALAVSAAGAASQPDADASAPAAAALPGEPLPAGPAASGAATPTEPAPVPTRTVAPARHVAKPASPSRGVELLVLSGDTGFQTALQAALGGGYRLHAADDVGAAAAVLEQHPVGVLITDTAVDADAVHELTVQLKHFVPELVTIVASDHSDAHRLIDLINGGQVFRFLLKPIKPVQTAIWIESAVGKHLELVSHPELLARHAVAAPKGSLLALGDRFLKSLAHRFLRLRARSGLSAPGTGAP